MEQTGIEGAWVFTPRVHRDQRGSLREWFHGGDLARQLGRQPQISQVICSTSRRGVIRGIHFTQCPPGQAKYIWCMSGAIMDVVVDVRVGSRAYGRWRAITLSEDNGRAVFISEGLGHAFTALSDPATVCYLLSAPYVPEIEHTISPFDPAIGISWPAGLQPILSHKDAVAPSLAEVARTGVLPAWPACSPDGAERRASPGAAAAGRGAPGTSRATRPPSSRMA